MYILGISAFYHDSAACILRDGKIVAAVQEERFSRQKHDPDFPKQAIDYCLRAANITIYEVDFIAFYENHKLKFDRLIKTHLMYAPKGLFTFQEAMSVWLTKKLWMGKFIQKNLNIEKRVYFLKHHESHAASAFYPSPFKSAAFLTTDAVGEWTTTSFGRGQGNNINIEAELKFPHSLGMLYSAFTYYTGFKVNSGEYKLMGLAPYGEPKYVNKIYDNLIDLKTDGSFKLNMKYFDFAIGNAMTNENLNSLFKRKPRAQESKISQFDLDLASSIQVVTEEILLKIVNHVYTQTGEKNLCMAGGVALNCVASERILKEGPFDALWIQPAAGDAGGALGAALYVWHEYLDNPRRVKKTDSQNGSYLGPEYSDLEIKVFLEEHDYPYVRLKKAQLLDHIAELIIKQNVVGWYQGRMEYGPRALGNRSILGDARSPKMQKIMNLKIKFRESFRPFAPSVLAEYTHEWFDLYNKSGKKVYSPYMLLTAPVKKDKRKRLTPKQKNLSGLEKLQLKYSQIPAVTHVNNSARLQTVHQQTNPLYHKLISAFYKKTGCPVIVNTSFNVRGEPIVESPEQAYTCFMRTDMDYLVMGSFLLDKSKQPPMAEIKDWKEEFGLD